MIKNEKCVFILGSVALVSFSSVTLFQSNTVGGSMGRVGLQTANPNTQRRRNHSRRQLGYMRLCLLHWRKTRPRTMVSISPLSSLSIYRVPLVLVETWRLTVTLSGPLSCLGTVEACPGTVASTFHHLFKRARAQMVKCTRAQHACVPSIQMTGLWGACPGP